MKGKAILVGMACVGLVGCSSAPGTAKQQGAVVGGATGAAVGASVTKNRALGAVIGGAVGAAGGYVIGGKTGHIDKDKNNRTVDNSGQQTAAVTADANHDGFVTLDEIADMESSGLSDEEIMRRVQATGLTFELTSDNRKYLSDRGVSQAVLDYLNTVNRAALNTTTSTQTQPTGSTVITK